MIDPLVRPATRDDVAQLDFLAAEARDGLRGQRGGERWLQTHPLPHWERDDVVVGHIGDVIVGYLVISLSDGVARVGEVYVTPKARELGFGDALLAAGIDRARAAGARLLEGESLPGDRETKNLYERAGIKARLITVSTPI